MLLPSPLPKAYDPRLNKLHLLLCIKEESNNFPCSGEEAKMWKFYRHTDNRQSEKHFWALSSTELKTVERFSKFTHQGTHEC